MKNFTPIAISLTAALMLQACANDSKKTQPTITTPAIVTPTTVTPTPTVVTPAPAVVTPAVVHHIQPNEVASYIEQFKTQRSTIKLELDGVLHDIELIDTYHSEKIILTRYANGYMLIGFDFEKEEPISLLQIIDSTEPSFDKAQQNFTRVLQSETIPISKENDNIIFEGNLTDAQTQGLISVRFILNESLISGGTSDIEVTGNKATVNGDLGAQTYIQITELINNYPTVNTLVLQQISGSVNDAINMHTGRLVRNAQFTTMVEATSDVNSGGVDLYAAGAQRIYTEGAKIGVHSWCCTDGLTADKLGREHAGHGAQLTYFREMLGDDLGPDFYFFTIEASPFDSVHVMTQAELDKYLLIQ